MNDLVQSHCTSLEAPDFQAIRQLTRAEAGTRLKAILTSLVGAEEHAPDETDVCPHGITFDEECEACEEDSKLCGYRDVFDSEGEQ